MSGSSLDGLDIVFAEFQETAGRWSFDIRASACYPYPASWKKRLEEAPSLNALDYQLLHVEYGEYTGQAVNRFIEENSLHFQVGLISSHGHTSFHLPAKKMTAQLGEGAAIAAATGLPVVSDLRALDLAFGGQGAPIVPIGEKLLFEEFSLFLNLGGIANISFRLTDGYIAFDVCPANRVLNLISAQVGKEYDEGGQMAARGILHNDLLARLDQLDFYRQPFPKSLANSFGTEEIFPMLVNSGWPHEDLLRTYTEHIVQQIKFAVADHYRAADLPSRILVTGGGAFNSFLVQRLSDELSSAGIEVVIPDENTVKYKEALVMAFIGVLRWRQESNVLSSVTGALRDSIGGALWTGQEA